MMGTGKNVEPAESRLDTEREYDHPENGGCCSATMAELEIGLTAAAMECVRKFAGGHACLSSTAPMMH